MKTEVFQAFANDITNCHSGIQGGVRILEDHLGSLFKPQTVFFSHFCHITTGVFNDTFGCRIKTKNGSSAGGLTTAGLSYQTKGFLS